MSDSDVLTVVSLHVGLLCRIQVTVKILVSRSSIMGRVDQDTRDLKRAAKSCKKYYQCMQSRDKTPTTPIQVFPSVMIITAERSPVPGSLLVNVFPVLYTHVRFSTLVSLC